MRTIRGKFVGNLRISPARRCKRHALDAFVKPSPAITGRGLREGAALPPVREQASLQKQSPARTAGLFTCEQRRV
jgi:hypothetical protein